MHGRLGGREVLGDTGGREASYEAEILVLVKDGATWAGRRSEGREKEKRLENQSGSGWEYQHREGPWLLTVGSVHSVMCLLDESSSPSLCRERREAGFTVLKSVPVMPASRELSTNQSPLCSALKKQCWKAYK